MKKVVMSLGLGLMATLFVAGQQSKPFIKFSETVHDFGDIKEEAGRTAYSFELTNSGGQPLVIHNVTASCGCTAPDWSRTPIPPRGKGFVKATYDPANRPGPFNKTITVASNAQESSVILRITGNVIPRAKTVEDIYPKAMGALRLKAGHLSMTRVAPGTQKVERLEMINTSDKPIKISFERVPAHLTLVAQPAELKPQETGVITATFDASKKNDWGFVSDMVFVLVDGVKDMNNNRLSVSATIEEDYSVLTPQELASAPKAEFADKSFNFGQIKEGTKVTHNYELKNVGKSNLIIRKVKASCGCTAVQPAKMMLAPGESTSIKAEFDSKGRTGRQSKGITVITNDPTASTTILQFTAEVVK
ncbi:DUF1573 domain-containing protein [Breznakibacter xylanolyticus]|nr:DUF1573 domain-containing protein [Breznakibacter xylanolyticus]